ncbi:MAG: hypothetical protein ACRDIA_08350, partial [Actinomycetota bacterium]
SSIKVRHPSQSIAVDEARRTFIEETRGTVDPHALFWYEAFAQLKRAVSASLRPGSRAQEKAKVLLEAAAGWKAAFPGDV